MRRPSRLRDESGECLRGIGRVRVFTREVLLLLAMVATVSWLLIHLPATP